MLRGLIQPLNSRLLLLRFMLQNEEHCLINHLKTLVIQISNVDDVLVLGSIESLNSKEKTRAITNLFSDVLISARAYIVDHNLDDASFCSYIISQVPLLLGVAFDLDSFFSTQDSPTAGASLNRMKNCSIFIGWIVSLIGQNRAKQSIHLSHSPKPVLLWSEIFEHNLNSLSTDERLHSVSNVLLRDDDGLRLCPYEKHDHLIYPFREFLEEVLSKYQACYTTLRRSRSYQQFVNIKINSKSLDHVIANIIVMFVESSLCLSASFKKLLKFKEISWIMKSLLNVSICLWGSAVMDHLLSSSTRKQLISLLSRISSSQSQNNDWKQQATLVIAGYTRYLEHRPMVRKIRPFFKLDPKVEVK